MSCKTETQTIGEVEYTCTQFPAIDALTYKMKLIQVFGPAIAAVVQSLPQDGIDETDKDNQQVIALSSGISRLFASASPTDVVELMVNMLTSGNTSRDGVRLTRALFEQHFSGDDLVNAYKVFIFVIKANYAGFFKGQKASDFLTKIEGNL